MALERVLLSTPDGSSDIRIGPLDLDPDEAILSPAPRRVAILHDRAVDPAFVERTRAALDRGIDDLVLRGVEGGEGAKGLVPWGQTLAWLQEAEIDRQGLLVVVGGGTLADMGGFAAATWLRGIRWIGVPTTLLGMVDAFVGGKTGLNLAGEKNRVGAFHLPAVVLGDPAALAGLPDVEWRSGWVEVLKSAVIGDAQLLAAFESGESGPSLEKSSASLVDTLSRAIRVKCAIVEEDYREGDRRRVLNLGHTLGHALEAVRAPALRHGEAVAIGLVFAARLAEDLGHGSRESRLTSRLAALLERWGLPRTWDPGDTDALLDRMGRDKKAVGGTLWMALPSAPGRVEMVAVSREAIERRLRRGAEIE